MNNTGKKNPGMGEQLEKRLASTQKRVGNSQRFISTICSEFEKHNRIAQINYERYDVKRGLRNADGTGVLAGVTQIGNVQGYYLQEGERIPREGCLMYRGYDINDLVNNAREEGRFGYEETAYLLLFGALPTPEQLADFTEILAEWSPLPTRFTEDMILSVPSTSVMNKLARSVLALYSYDEAPDNNELQAELFRAIRLIARFPTIVAHGYAAKVHYFDHQSLYLHLPQKDLSVAENFLRLIRPDSQYTPEEARLLDLCLMVHAEHGGGNNSTFVCRAVSSSGTDTYSAVAAAVGSLKGPRHGGANERVLAMMTRLEQEVENWTDEDAIRRWLTRRLTGEAGPDNLIYGMGHAVYTLSDPRATILKTFARTLAEEKGMADELDLFERVERIAPEVIEAVKGEGAGSCANVDFYSGLVYKMLGIPLSLYTPLFATARISGWCAHRIEELYNKGNKIIRPAYKCVLPPKPYVPLAERE